MGNRASCGCAISQKPAIPRARTVSRIRRLDPLARDRRSDAGRWMSHRALSRLIHVAVETGHRFGREGLEGDPVAWMYRPLCLFEGEAAITACAERQGFADAVALHGLWPALDGEVSVIEGLLAPPRARIDDVSGEPAIDLRRDV